jgi:hypothetical protein
MYRKSKSINLKKIYIRLNTYFMFYLVNSARKKLSVPFRYHGVPVGLVPFRELVPLGRRNRVPILPPAHPLDVTTQCNSSLWALCSRWVVHRRHVALTKLSVHTHHLSLFRVPWRLIFFPRPEYSWKIARWTLNTNIKFTTERFHLIFLIF